MKLIKQWFFDFLLYYVEDKWLSRITDWLYKGKTPEWESKWCMWVFINHCDKFKLTPEEEKQCHG